MGKGKGEVGGVEVGCYFKQFAHLWKSHVTTCTCKQELQVPSNTLNTIMSTITHHLW